MNPKYPVYIISKGRAETRQTSIGLEKMKVPYHIVIEPQEYKEYNKYIHKDKIKVLPFSNLGQGSIPARNWCWQDSIERGFERHWLLDDNIPYFNRLNRNYQIRVTSGTIFKIMEDFVDRYENIALAGPSYDFFTIAKTKMPPFVTNTRIYSVLLIKNNIPYKWRGKFNEDTDLSIRALKDGWCTVQFNAFTQEKATTMTMKGGNTNELYENTNNRKEFAESLQKQHPDIVKVVWRYNRWHHQVDYRPFKKNKLIFKKDYIKKTGVNNYGMKIVKI
jgi:hypothetical protein|tara:strand:+ start:959 stop:1786 length:828 start_codon:yes stop_codon:yes gene_type:complete